MEIKDGDYVLGIWFMEKKHFGNWQMTVIKRGDKWLGEHRFRYYEDGRVWNSNDRKSFYGMEFKNISEPELEEKLNCVFADFSKVYQPDHKEFVEIKSNDIHKIIFKMALAPWINMGKMTREEAGYGKDDRGSSKDSISEDNDKTDGIQR